MTARYMLEIYAPGSADDVIRYFESDHPITGVSKGDFIKILGHRDGDSDFFVRAINIEHILWTLHNELRHKICVFTQAAADSREERTTYHGQ